MEPSAGISEFVGDHSHAIKIGVIVVHLSDWISPSITYSHSFKYDLGRVEERSISDDLGGEGRDVVSCKGLSGDVERTGFKGRPLIIQI